MVGAGNRLIPRSIVQFWDDPAVPAEIARLTESWNDQNPGYAYRLFDRHSAGDFLRRNNGPEVLAAFDRAEGPAQQADIFRLAYLASHGGYYADADDRCSTALDRFIPANAAFVVFQEEYGTLGNNFIGVTPDHPAITTALALAVEAVNRGDRDIVWLSTGPGLLTRAFALTLAAGQHELSRSAIFTVGQIQHFLGLHCPAAYKSTRRHWLKSSFGARPNGRREVYLDPEQRLAIRLRMTPLITVTRKRSKYVAETSAAPRSRVHRDHARRGRRVQKAGDAVFDRQGFQRHAACRAQGVLSGETALPAAACRHHLEVPRHDRVSRCRPRGGSGSI